MKLNKNYYKNSDETVYSTKLSNGLNVFLIPKPEYSETAAVFATKFGSLESNAILKLNGNTIKGKLGVAHFLEHRMFDNPKGPVFDLFSNLGAISNAFTSFDKTAYYFVASNKLESNTELLLDFVQGLEIKKESVEKEKGIIIEELKMYLDMPESRLGRGILENMYINHPIKHDIGGTIEEVASTSLEVLQACHQTFYHPNNMVLVIVGQMKVDSIIKVIEKNQNAKFLKPQLKPVFVKVNEPLSVKFKYRQIQMPISTKKIAIGYKLKPIDNLTNIQINKRLIAYSIYQDMLFSESAPFYQNLIKSKIINTTMDVSAFQGAAYNAMIIESEVLDEAKFIKAIDDQIKNANVGLMEKEFQIVKNLNVSEAIRSYESPQRLAINYMSNYFDGVNVFDDLDSIKNITLKDIVKVAAEIRQGKKSVFVIKPMVKN